MVAWLNDRILAAFGRHEAPVLAGVPGLAPDETVFVISGLVPNRKSHPLVYEWVGITFRDGRFESLTAFDDVIERTGLGGGTPIANRELLVDVEALARLLPAAVEEAWRHIVERRNQFEREINANLDEEQRALEQLRARCFAQLELKLEQSAQPAAHKTHREERALRHRGGVQRLLGLDSGNLGHGRDTVARGYLRDGGGRLTNLGSTLWIYTVSGGFITLYRLRG